MTIVAKLDFIQLNNALKLVFCRNVSSKLANVAIFPTIDIPIATINTLIDEFETAILNAKDGSHIAALLLQDKVKQINEMFHLLVNYVNKVAKGDETIIAQSGFNASKVPTPHQKAEIAVKSGASSGIVIVDIKAVKGAVARAGAENLNKAISENLLPFKVREDIRMDQKNEKKSKKKSLTSI